MSNEQFQWVQGKKQGKPVGVQPETWKRARTLGKRGPGGPNVGVHTNHDRLKIDPSTRCDTPW